MEGLEIFKTESHCVGEGSQKYEKKIEELDGFLYAQCIQSGTCVGI